MGQTNANGLITLELGGGQVVSGNFSGVNWGSGLYFLRMEADVSGGTNYAVVQTTQLLSVPYALYSEKSSGLVLPPTIPPGNGQLYYCNGQLQLTPCSLRIGQFYEGGYIFYLDSTGLNGLVCAPTDVGSFPWGCFTFVPGTDTSIGSGQSNTSIMVNACSQTNATAARVCSDWVYNGFDDWFLPSQNELQLVYRNLVISGITTFSSQTAGPPYWTSNQVPLGFPWSSGSGVWVHMGDGHASMNAKQVPQGVRAVRAFSRPCNPCLPTVITHSVSNVTHNSAGVFGEVSSEGGARVIAKGVTYDTMPNPTINGNLTTGGSGSGPWHITINGLYPMQQYYARAYATNSVGTAYGSMVTFTTTPPPFICGTTMVTDVDGNSYNTVQIGTQCWTQSNLTVSKYRNGNSIPNITTPNTLWGNTTSGAWCNYLNDSSHGTIYGKLYNWYAVNDARGLCPTGWHVPTDSEWNVMVKYLDPNADTICANCTQSSTAGGALKSTTGWNSPNSGATNSSGFTGLPGGYRYITGDWHGAGASEGNWWSSSDTGSGNAWLRSLNSANAHVVRSNDGHTYWSFGFSVRCLRD